MDGSTHLQAQATARKGKQSKKLRKGIGSMNLNTCHMTVTELKHLDGLLKENRKEEAKEYIISTKQDYLKRIIQAHLHGYWFMRIKYSQKEERFLQTAEKR